MYTLDKANLITQQLTKFRHGYTHHVVGQFANIDFWINEVKSTLTVLDQHRSRFDKMYNAQKNWTEEHGTVVHTYCSICKGKCEFSDGKPRLPNMKYKGEKVAARKELIDAAYFFLIRCYTIGLLTREQLEQKCNEVGTSIDPADLKKRNDAI
ncbi:MAG: hypothetical protein JJ975_16375 [Bacteroidia bacterium]|nr:hypothetical protein [Bacteroidia bacterium]